MLRDDFYTVHNETTEEHSLSATLQLNAAHDIFKGHFPSIPVVPGVCSMQIIRELTEKATERRLVLKKADFLKFLGVITPTATPELNAAVSWQDAENGELSVSGTLFKDETVFLKFRGSFASL